MSNAKKSAVVFSMAAAILLMLATEVLVGYHYWRMLYGVSLIALGGLLFVAWVLGWATWWASRAGEDRRVKYTAYFVAFAVSTVMILNGAAVVVILRNDWAAETSQKREIDKIKARGDVAAKLKQAGGTWRDVREVQRAEVDRDKAAAASVKPMDEDTAKMLEWVDKYGQFYIFVVPFLVALLGKFILLGAIALPGGAEGFIPGNTEAPRPPVRPGFAPPMSYNVVPGVAADPKGQPPKD